MLSFEEAFMKIEEATGIKDTDVLVTQFIKAEERNFGLFKFINDQAEDIDRMESQISTITQEIERLRDATDLTNQDIQRRRDIKQMEVKLREALMLMRIRLAFGSFTTLWVNELKAVFL